MIQDNYLDNTAIKDLNLEATNDDFQKFDKLDGETKLSLNLENLISDAQEQALDKSATLDQPEDTQQVAGTQGADEVTQQTTFDPDAMMNDARTFTKQNDQFSNYQKYFSPRLEPEAQTRRFREGPGGYIYGRDNEDAQAKAEGFWTNLGKGLVRLPMSIGIKTGQSVGFIFGLANPTNWGADYIDNASKNAIAQVFSSMDESMKEDWLPVYQKAEAKDKGFWWRATHDMNFWTSDFVDGVAFMASAYAPGGILSKLGLGQRIAKGLSAFKWGAESADLAIEGAAKAQNYLTKAQSIWANRINKFNQWALSVGGEAMFEAKEVGDNIKKGLTYDENGQIRIDPETGLPYTEEKKKQIAGANMRSTFLSNAALLAATNALELKWMNSMLGKVESRAVKKGLSGGAKIGDDLAFSLSNTGISKLLDSKTGHFLKGLGKGIMIEGFAEENFQLAIQRINEMYGIQGKVTDFASNKEVLGKGFKQIGDALSGRDPEASVSIGLGGILGGGMSGISGYKERKANVAYTEAGVKFYNEAQKNWLKFGNIFKTEQVTEKDEKGFDINVERVVLDENGQPTIDEGKLASIANNFNNAASVIEASNMLENKFKRDILRDSAWADFVKAHIQLGMEKELFAKLGAIERTDAGDLAKLGFVADDSTTTQLQKYKNLTQLIIDQNKIMNDDIIFETDWKGNIKPEEEARRNRMMELATQQAVFRNLSSELDAQIQETNNYILKNVQAHTSLSDGLVDQLNNLLLRVSSQRQVVDEYKLDGKKPLELAMAKTVLNDLISEFQDLKSENKESLKKLRKGEDGFYKYEKEVRNSPQNVSLRNKLYGIYARKGNLQNYITQSGLEWAKYADTKNGKKNFKDYIDNVVVKPINEALERAEIGKSSKMTDEERAQKRKNRQEKDYEKRQPWTKKGTSASFLYRMKDDDRVGEDIMEYYDLQDGEITDAASFIKKAIDNPYTDPYLKRILSRLLPFVKPGFKIKFDTKQTIAPGFYTLGSDMITLDPELHEAQLSFEGVLLHELIHQLTSDELADKGLFAKNIKELYDYAKAHLESRGIDTSYYGFTNIHEFLAEAYSNPEFQRELASVPGKTGFTSMWQDFLAALSDFFRRTFKMDIKPSVLDDIFFKVEEYLDDRVFKMAKLKLMDNGLTDEEVDRYSKREIIDLAIKEGLITEDLLQPEYKIFQEEQQAAQQQSQQQPGQTGPSVKIDDSIEYSYKGKKYGIFQMSDQEVLLVSPTDPDDTYQFTANEILQMIANNEITPYQETPTGKETIADTLQGHLQEMYKKAKELAQNQGRTVAPFDTWMKTAGKFETDRYKRLKAQGAQQAVTPTPGPVDELTKQVDALEQEKKQKLSELYEKGFIDILPVTPDTPLESVKEAIDSLEQDGLVDAADIQKARQTYEDAVKLSEEYEARKEALSKSADQVNALSGIKVNNEYADDQGNIYKIASIIPNKAVSYIKTTPSNQSSVERMDINDFAAAVANGSITLQQTAFEEDTDFGENAVKDYVQNGRFDNSGLETLSTDNKAANITLQEGPKQLAPHNSLANTTDLVEERPVGNRIVRMRVGVNSNYVFDVATSNFLPGKTVVYRMMVDDFPTGVRNRLTNEVYDASKIYTADGKVKPEMADFAPIGVYSVIEGKEVLIGTIHDPQWIEYKIGDEYANIVIPENERSQPYPETVKKEVEKNKKLRNFIIENYNKDPKFQMTAVVEDKSIGILRTLSQPGLIADRVNPKIAEGGLDNRHGMFGIVRNGSIEVSRSVEIDNIEEVEMKNNEGASLLLLPTPRGTYFPTSIKLPRVSTDQANFIIESWKAFTGQQENQELVKAIYDAQGLVMSEGTPDIGVLQNYIDQYITILDKNELSVSGGVELPNGTARLNITDKGHLYLQVKAKDGTWFNNNGKPIVTADKLPDDAISLMQNLLTTVKFTNSKNKSLVGINNPKKIGFVSIENGKVVKKMMTYNEYIMQNASTYVENGIPSKNKTGDWVYFANPVVKMTSTPVNTNDGAKNPLVQTQPAQDPGDTFDTPPSPVTPKPVTPTDPKTEIENRIGSLSGSSLGFSSRTTPGTSKWTKDGVQVTFEKSQRDKYGRGSELFTITYPDGRKESVSADYKRRPTGGFSGLEELPFEAKYSENPKELFDKLEQLNKPAAPASTDAKADIERRKKEIEDFRTEAKEDIGSSVLGTKGQRWGTVIRLHKKQNTSLTKQFKLTDFESRELLEKEIDKIYDAELAALEGEDTAKAAEVTTGEAPTQALTTDQMIEMLNRAAQANNLTDKQINDQSKLC
jgi:hypothetical protein